MDFVWIFNGTKGRFPSGAFSTREQAEQWIATHRLEGTLTRYPVGVGAYDWAVSNGMFAPKRPDQASPEFIGNFSSASLEHHHYDAEGS